MRGDVPLEGGAVCAGMLVICDDEFGDGLSPLVLPDAQSLKGGRVGMQGRPACRFLKCVIRAWALALPGFEYPTGCTAHVMIAVAALNQGELRKAQENVSYLLCSLRICRKSRVHSLHRRAVPTAFPERTICTI